MYDVRTFDLAGVEGLSRRAIELHLALYKGYVGEVNQLLTEIRSTGQAAQPDDLVYHARARRLAFEWNGMVLHELFFEALRRPGENFDPQGVFAEALDQSFGGFASWKQDFLRTAGLRGSGWVVAVREAATNRVFNVWLDEHQLGMPACVEPVMVLDLWEHAYLIDYPPAKRADYVETVLSNIDWAVIEGRCTVATD